ncbi:MAG: hypothetical protein A2857_05700 [Candidatus Levybacteria bacterium RIFCSPHIGHO2_01_FULL_36_15]|nr:MAG: hypothetical protein A2857_05700 [Candidatus Levybacteria bacterium RIFCSPHIGHO2_01_FULL_36_15]OGH38395.1 MAG: hypothetical protein A2905_00500 [Candidatus Levybacteria bacterium RIFCSPLOWO2_01_FULL_36_10]
MNLFARLLSSFFNPFIIALLSPFLVVYKSTKDMIYALKWEVFSLVFFIVAVIFVFTLITYFVVQYLLS